MFDSLFSKLAVVLLGLFLLAGGMLLVLAQDASRLYQQEVAQRLNAGLAEQLVAEFPLIRDSRPNPVATEHLFHQLMVVNPSIEVYLLDPAGRLLAWSAPGQSLHRERVDLAPVRAYLDADHPFPLLGDDPRDAGRRKVFSAAAIHEQGRLQAYLYVILASEAYAGIADALRASYALRLGAWGLAASLGLALLIGLLLFGWLTRRLRRLARHMDLLASVSPAPDPGGGDELTRLERRFDHMAAQIRRQLQTLTSMDAQRRELVASVSHDLRTPLTTLHGYLETLCLKDERLTPEQRHQYLRTAVRNSEELARLVEQLFELARLDAADAKPRAERFALGDLVHDTLAKYRLTAQQRDIGLAVDDADGLPLVLADIGLIQRALDNLLDNALRHTPDGGHIAVHLAAGDGQVRVEVSDTGCGIPASELPKVFERFYRRDCQPDQAEGHAGLGLAIAKRIVELHGAAISARSTLGLGTTFSFELPCPVTKT